MAQKSEYTGAQLTFAHHQSGVLGSMDTHVHEGVGEGVGLSSGEVAAAATGTGTARCRRRRRRTSWPRRGRGRRRAQSRCEAGRTDGDGVGRDEGDDVGRGDGAGVGPGVAAADEENGFDVQPVWLEAQAPPTTSTAVGAQVVQAGVPGSAQSPAQLLPPA